MCLTMQPIRYPHEQISYCGHFIHISEYKLLGGSWSSLLSSAGTKYYICCIEEHPQGHSLKMSLLRSFLPLQVNLLLDPSPSSSLAWKTCLPVPIAPCSQQPKKQGIEQKRHIPIALITSSRPLSLPTGSNTIPFSECIFHPLESKQPNK